MQRTRSDGIINTESSLKAFFHDALCRVSREKSVEVNESTLWYLTNLLDDYSRSDQFFDFRPDGGTLTPLAEYYMNAIQAESQQLRRLYLRRLGDVSIFISGLFAPALDRKAVNLGYYMAMGENAYGWLADTARDTTKEQALAEVFSELSGHFSDLVSVLSAVSSEGQPLEPADNLLKLLDEWERTGDSSLEKQLRRRGVMLDPNAVTAH